MGYGTVKTLKRVPSLTITASVDGVDEPYTLCGNFIGTLKGFEDEGNHSVAKEIKNRLPNHILQSVDFDPEYSQLYVYGNFENLYYIALVLASMYDEVNDD